MWLGITADEAGRVKPSDVGYVENRWPLLESHPVWYRVDVVAWLRSQGLDVPPRSACVFCPYQSAIEWRRLRTGDDWERAVAADERIREARTSVRDGYGWRGQLFVHPARIPLRQVDLRDARERGQLALFEDGGHDNECSGTCFL
jgi:hypothetical protein